ncbi:MAG: methyltransferase domain-containing protein [Aggregatilineales bacterium]
MQLRTINSLYISLYFDVPRPKALLGHQHFHRLLDEIRDVYKLQKTTFDNFYISAAGSESSVMQRLKRELGDALNLPEGSENGDLLIRLRRANKGWEILIRITPRPHATRLWRVCNFEGALNGPVASSMIQLSKPSREDIVVNLACGSGTIMIERLLSTGVSKIIGCDNDELALACARENLNASFVTGTDLELIRTDVKSLPLPSNFANRLYADLPFGQLVGSHQDNIKQYPQIFDEAARIATPDAIFTVITHEVKLIESVLANNRSWYAQQIIKVSLRGLHPRIYVLSKRNGSQ